MLLAAELPALLLPWEQAVTTCLTAQLMAGAPGSSSEPHGWLRDARVIPLSPQPSIYTVPPGCCHRSRVFILPPCDLDSTFPFFFRAGNISPKAFVS